MKVLSSAFASVLLFASSVLAATGALQARSPIPSPPPQNGYAPPPSSSAAAGGSPTLSSQNAGAQGDSKCVNAMCVEAMVNGSTVTYTLTSRQSNVGWMAMGFGTQMARTPMVIMWANADGTVTLSQRQAPATVMPTVVANPPRIATAQNSLSLTSGDSPRYVYSIPANQDTTQNIIYALGTVRPSSSSPDATLVQHVDQGTMTLDLTGTISGSSGAPNSAPGSSIPLSSNQKTILAHAIVATLGFLLFLPIGALVPRWARTFIAGPKWFRVHWIVQFIFSGTLILVGVALGIASVSNRGASHVNTTHKRLGVVLFALYFLQVAIGAFIHWVKPKGPRVRPPQNYFHAILGIIIIALAFYQVRLGFRTEWVRATGRDDVPNGVNIVWYIWVVLLPLAYGAGLALLPKQYAQEKKDRLSAGYNR